MRHFLACIALVGLLAPAAPATTYFVRTSGSDSNAGTSKAAAFRTVKKAFNTVHAGDTVYIGAGTYTEDLPQPSGGSAGAPVRFVGDTDGAMTGDAGTVTLTYWSQPVVFIKNADYISLERLVISGGTTGVSLQGAEGCSMIACTVQSSSAGGVYLKNSSLTLAGCTVQNLGGDGVEAYINSTVAVQGGTIKSCGGSCISVTHTNASALVDSADLLSSGGRGVNITSGIATITNSVITGVALAVYAGGSGAQVWNTTIVSCGGGIQSSSSLTVRNTIIAQSGTAIQRFGGTLTSGYNLFYNNGTNYSGATSGAGDISGNPSFASGGYRLQPGSPAIDAGTSASAFMATDKDGYARPAGAGWDIGAYEYGSSAPVATPRITRWIEVQPGS